MYGGFVTTASNCSQRARFQQIRPHKSDAPPNTIHTRIALRHIECSSRDIQRHHPRQWQGMRQRHSYRT